MKIFIIPSWYPSKKNEGACPFIYEQAVALQRMGHEVVVLSIQMLPINTLFKQKEDAFNVRMGGVATFYKEATFFYPGRIFAVNEYHFIKSLQHVFDEAVKEYGCPDVLYAHFSYPAGYAAGVLSKERNIPLVVQEHWSNFNREHVAFPLRKILYKTIERANTFVAVSTGLQSSIERHVKIKHKKITVVSNMIDPCFKFVPKQKHNGFIFFSMGNFIPQKGFIELIEAFAYAFSGNLEIKLLIAGSGPLENDMKELIKKKNLENQVILLGRLTREETLKEYITCDCFVLASKGETFGLVYREALAVGRPIISTRHQGFSDKDWHDCYGWLVDIDNQKQLEFALKTAYEYCDYSGEERSKKCLQSCSSDIVMTRIEKILQDAVDKGGSN